MQKHKQSTGKISYECSVEQK